MDPLLVNLLRTGRVPFWNQSKLYLLNAWLVLRFLYKTDNVSNPEQGQVTAISRLIAAH